MPKLSFALNELDVKLAQHVKNRGGFFVEAGANNGISQSNTLYFERYLGWTGLLVEPIPELAAACAANRPLCSVEQAALVPFGQEGQQVQMSYCNLMSIVHGARGTPEQDRSHLELGSNHLATGDTVRSVSVKGDSLSNILEKHHVEHIDLLVLDVEGFEAQALDGLDLERHSPTWILVEANFAEDVHRRLADRYHVVARLSHHDVLYKLRCGSKNH